MMLRKKVVIQAPRRVVVLGEELLPPEPHEVLVDTLYSAVSAGTEMLAYRGEMPPEISADATISGLQKPFGYPIAYGYAAVGRVSSVGASVKGFSPGELVFGFREHCSAFCAPASSLLKVPDGIDPKNACMLPSVETAVSIATDATLLPGESAVVVGQGAIGLLTVAVLKLLHPFSVVVGVELSEARRRLSVTCANADACFGAEAGLNSLAFVPHFDPAGTDVAIDTSGAAAGLDTAIRLTRDAGRVVLASWFGSKAVSLHALGGRFHRSHVSIVASQVSSIPPSISGRWTKQRRFELAWRVLKTLKPAERFPVTVVHVSRAPVLFAEIDRGEHVQAILEYR